MFLIVWGAVITLSSVSLLPFFSLQFIRLSSAIPDWLHRYPFPLLPFFPYVPLLCGEISLPAGYGIHFLSTYKRINNKVKYIFGHYILAPPPLSKSLLLVGQLYSLAHNMPKLLFLKPNRFQILAPTASLYSFADFIKLPCVGGQCSNSSQLHSDSWDKSATAGDFASTGNLPIDCADWSCETAISFHITSARVRQVMAVNGWAAISHFVLSRRFDTLGPITSSSTKRANSRYSWYAEFLVTAY